MIKKDGSSFEGVFKNDQYHGYGVEIDVFGFKYEGNWKEGKKEGVGIQTIKNGESIRGVWKNNAPVDFL
jgi:1-phosphatidylinositol-4-phosphate 5-kinase